MRGSKNVCTSIAWLCGLLVCFQASAQIKVTFPVSRQVIQRDNNNQATVQIAGSFSQQLSSVEACVVARAAGQGTTTNWTTLQTSPTNGQFNGTLVAKGGWYTVKVRGIYNGAVVATDSVDRFGIGEVFGIIGHSNAQGSACYVNNTDMCTTIDGAVDDRVTVVTLDSNSPDFQQYLNTAQTRYLPGALFNKLVNLSGISPFGGMPWLWGHMGDVLVQRINVPILIYNAGFGGTTMQQNWYAACNVPFQHGFVRYDLRMPYANFRNLMNLYVPSTGIRAVLIQHGENDRGNSSDIVQTSYTKVIDTLRIEFNKPNLACIIAISSYAGGRFDNVRTGQINVLNRQNYKVYQGPDLDNIYSSDDRPDGIHFSHNSGQTKAGEAWANAITDTYLSTITPYQALLEPITSLACASGNQLQLSPPTGYQPLWSNDGSLTGSQTVGTGTYSARMTNSQNQVFFSPAVVVPSSVQPTTPTISSAGNTTAICRTTGLTLASSYSGPNVWSTGATSSSITVSSAGSYSLQAKNPVYGCLSNTVSTAIGLATTNLSISMATSRRVVALNDTVSFRFTVQNKGECDAGPVRIQSRLPDNMTFVSSADNLTQASNIVGGSTGNILAGASVSNRYVARMTGLGTYVTAGEITTTTNPILYATLNNGTANGESDETQTDLRTTSATSTSASVYVSPNPNQVQLPAVQSNQPAPDANSADLSLGMQLGSLIARSGQPFAVTLVVSNRGGQSANSVTVRDSLPAGFQFVSSPSGMTAAVVSATVSGGTTVNTLVVTGSAANIAAGQSATLIFYVQATGTGTFTNWAQITVADPSNDPDSKPNNGYTNGEDDQSSATFRVSP